MRLIDADVLKEVISNNPLIDFTDDDLFEIIDNAPTISDGSSIQMNEKEENQVHRLKMALCSLILNADDKQIFKIFEIIWRSI